MSKSPKSEVAAAPVAPVAKVGRRTLIAVPAFTDATKIKVVAPKNPSREGSIRAKAFSLYKTGMTVGEYAALVKPLKKSGKKYVARNYAHGEIEFLAS